MAKLVVNNSQMQCSQGTDISAINISSQNIVAIAGEFVATEEDKISVDNITSFGVCKCSSPNPPCLPQPQGWQQTTKKDSINGMKKLTEQSFCMCARGGRISFVDTGNNTFVESE
jgi:hypothetical protein